jgi:hypothetical protein
MIPDMIDLMFFFLSFSSYYSYYFALFPSDCIPSAPIVCLSRIMYMVVGICMNLRECCIMMEDSEVHVRTQDTQDISDGSFPAFIQAHRFFFTYFFSGLIHWKNWSQVFAVEILYMLLSLGVPIQKATYSVRTPMRRNSIDFLKHMFTLLLCPSLDRM